MAKYYRHSDGWFQYFINAETGKKQFNVEENAEIIDRQYDDFCRANKEVCNEENGFTDLY